MPYPPVLSFSVANRRRLVLLIASHFLWSGAIFGLWAGGQLFAAADLWWSLLFIALQLFAATQLLLPALILHPEERRRSFYLFWGATLALTIWLTNQIAAEGIWQPLLLAIKSGLLLLVAALTGAAMARYVHRLWELVPICLVMTLADFSSWLYGPTAGFAEEIQHYYQTFEGPPPLIDMILIKLALPGSAGLAPLFGISDWIMVVFFAIVARRHGINDNLFGVSGERLAQHGRIGRYLPVSVVALFISTLAAQLTGLFIPALPVIAITMLLWYAARSLRRRYRTAHAATEMDKSGHA